MADFRYYLNKQGPKGAPGEKGEQGFSPNVTVETNTAAEYKLRITTETDSFVTDNLRGSAVDDQGGTYMRYDPETQAMYAGDLDLATDEDAGAVIIANDEDISTGATDRVVTAEQLQNAIESAGSQSTTTYATKEELSTEVSARTSTDVTLSTAISEETSTRVQEYTSLAASISTVASQIPDVSDFVTTTDLSDVAITGSYNDLLNKPVIGDGTLTFTQNTTTLGTFTANTTTNVTIDIPQGGSSYSAGQGIDVSNDTISAKVDNTNITFDSSNNITVTTNVVTQDTMTNYVTTSTFTTELTKYPESSTLATVATSGSYSDLINPPTIPTVNDSTVTFNYGTTEIGSITMNQSTSSTITVPEVQAGPQIDDSSTTTTSVWSSTKIEDEITTKVSEATSTMVTSDTVREIVTLTQAEYNTITPSSTTEYIITDGPETALADLSNTSTTLSTVFTTQINIDYSRKIDITSTVTTTSTQDRTYPYPVWVQVAESSTNSTIAYIIFECQGFQDWHGATQYNVTREWYPVPANVPFKVHLQGTPNNGYSCFVFPLVGGGH